MKRADTRSHCPVNYAVEVFGDSWSLLIIRDIVFWGKHTYGDFLQSEEAISTNILSARLAHLEQKGIVTKRTDTADRRRERYDLTEKGIALIPVLLEISGWSATYDAQTIAPKGFVEKVYANREALFAQVQDAVRSGGSLFGTVIKEA